MPFKCMKNMYLCIIFGALLIIGVAVAGEESAAGASSPVALKGEPIKPIPAEMDLDPGKAALGKRLFFDPIMSGDWSVSCNTCHNLGNSGIDDQQFSIDIQGGFDEMNTPTVFNSVFNFRLMWNGGARTLEEQIEMVMHNPKHMDSDWPTVIARLGVDDSYLQAFDSIYPDGITDRNIRDAVAVFESSLVTPNSRFDQYLLGDSEAITEDEKLGYSLFKSYGCVSCHQGVNVGGNIFARLGVYKDYFKDKQSQTRVDLGRFTVTGKKSDLHKFRVPSLRNVGKTAPYLHNGSEETLVEVVSTMALYQLGRRITDYDADRIVDFLNTLTGEYQGKPL